jgi:hypothetical protein
MSKNLMAYQIVNAQAVQQSIENYAIKYGILTCIGRVKRFFDSVELLPYSKHPNIECLTIQQIEIPQWLIPEGLLIKSLFSTYEANGV